jgi:hypothetical protein
VFKDGKKDVITLNYAFGFGAETIELKQNMGVKISWKAFTWII